MSIKSLLTLDEAADILRLTTTGVMRLVRGGELPAVFLPATEIRFEEAALQACIESHREHHAEVPK